MSALPFVRKTTLADDEARINFKQIDNAVILALVSKEACEVTAQMSRVYLGLLSAPAECWIKEGCIHLAGAPGVTAWQQMAALTGVADATLAKALRWMHERGIIGYDARMNGIGIRVWFNRAAESIKKRESNLRLVPPPAAPAPPGRPAPPETPLPVILPVSTPVEPISTPVEIPAMPEAIAVPVQKNLALSPTSFGESPTSLDEVAFKEKSYKRDLEKYRIRAEAARENISVFNLSTVLPSIIEALRPEIAAVVRREVSGFREAMQQEIAATVSREVAGLKTWMFNQAIPKAARVAHRETFDCLRSNGAVLANGAAEKKHASPDPGRAKPETSEEGNQQIQKILSFLTERQMMLDEAAQGAPEYLAEVMRVSAAEFGELAARVRSPEDALTLDEPIERIEQAILEAAWNSLDESIQSGLSDEARTELESYQHRTQPEVFADMARRRVNCKLRDLFSIPKLNLFYIQ